jgi:hypothetical protein
MLSDDITVLFECVRVAPFLLLNELRDYHRTRFKNNNNNNMVSTQICEREATPATLHLVF